ncbi:hypothetical protein F5Y16DRAFT_146082 [Xylariaceae sp. FL0255]|nr:hypothetical protein F5Y16DRAFT_146082 [Xylariaceae sp. FL0255]
MATDIVLHAPSRIDRLNAEDFETASIRSAAPSYVSEAPSYHTLPPNEVIPAYSPPSTTAINASSSRSSVANANATSTSTASSTTRASPQRQQSSSMLPPLIPSSSPLTRGAGLPPIPRRPAAASAEPTLAAFRAPLWSPVSPANNPQARHYQSVANRRAAAAASSYSSYSSPYSSFSSSSSSIGASSTNLVEDALRAAIDRVQAANADAGVSDEDGGLDGGRVRPLEDPYLVGEEAAARNRAARLSLLNGEDVLVREDRRWDWWHAQMRDLDSRERSWNAFRSNIESRGQRRFRFGR